MRHTPSWGLPHQVGYVPEDDSHQHPNLTQGVGMQGELFLRRYKLATALARIRGKFSSLIFAPFYPG